MKAPDIIKETARKLRNNMTESEVILWSSIKGWNLWIKFLRQKPMYVFTEDSWLDRFIIPDFYSFENKLIIEVDWNIHNLKDVYELDKYKETLLLSMWYTILRFTNEEIKNDLPNVLLKIIKYNS